MGYVILVLALVIFVGLSVSLQRSVRTRRRSLSRIGRSPDNNFEVIDWNGRPPPLSPAPRVRRPSKEFSDAVRRHNPDAICLLTGRRAADCTCEIHRSMT